MIQLSAREAAIRAIKIGLIVGLGAVYFAAIGIVERFEPRQVITDVLTLGLLAPAIMIALGGARAARAWRPGAAPLSPGLALAVGAIVGAVGGAVFGLFVILTANVNVQPVLASVSPALAQITTFGMDSTAAGLAYVPAGALIGLAGTVPALLPRLLSRPILTVLLAVLVVSLLEPMLRVVLLQLDLDDIARFSYRSGGLTIEGAFTTAIIAGALGLLRETQGEAISAMYAALPASRRRVAGMFSISASVVILAVVPLLIGSFLSEVVGTVGLFILMGLGLNIVVGYAGLLDLGYVAFFATGAYVTALLTSSASVLGLEASFWLILPVVMLVAAAFGILIGAPVLRLRGDYLAIVTLGFGEIVRILLLSDALRPWFGGAQGILSIPEPGPLVDVNLGGFELYIGATNEPQSLYYPILIFCVLGAFVAWSLARSRVGRAWNAMREDEEVAQATGINTTRYKLMAFSIGAVFGCVAGAFLAVKLGSVFPHRLDILVSITTLSLVILGGMGSIPGVIVGAFVLVGLPELLREFAEYRLLIYGVVLVVMMLLRPEGLIPNVTRRRELHDDAVPPDQLGGLAAPIAAAPATEGGRA
jgi:branched-chain amino acid transport system permease protein